MNISSPSATAAYTRFDDPWFKTKTPDYGSVQNFRDSSVASFDYSIGGGTFNVLQEAYWDNLSSSPKISKQEFEGTGLPDYGKKWHPNMSWATAGNMYEDACQEILRAHRLSNTGGRVMPQLIGGMVNPDLVLFALMPEMSITRAAVMEGAVGRATLSTARQVGSRAFLSAGAQNAATAAFLSATADYTGHPYSAEQAVMDLVTTPIGAGIGFGFQMHRLGATPKVTRMAASEITEALIGGKKRDAAAAWALLSSDPKVAGEAMMSGKARRILRQEAFSPEDWKFIRSFLPKAKSFDRPAAAALDDALNGKTFEEIHAGSREPASTGEKMLSSVFKELFGTEVRFHDKLSSSGRMFPDRPGTVFLRVGGSFREVSASAFHELVHGIQFRDPVAFRALLAAFEKYDTLLTPEASSRTLLERGLAQAKARYAKVWDRLTPDRKMMEGVAEAVAMASEHPQFWRTLYRGNPAAFSRFVEYVKNIFTKIRDKLEGEERARMSTLVIKIAEAVSSVDPEAHVRDPRWESFSFRSELFKGIRDKMARDNQLRIAFEQAADRAADELSEDVWKVEFPSGLGEWEVVPEKTKKLPAPQYIAYLNSYRKAFLGPVETPELLGKGIAKDHPVFFYQGRPVFASGGAHIDEIRFYRHKKGAGRSVESLPVSENSFDPESFSENLSSKFVDSFKELAATAREQLSSFISPWNMERLQTGGQWKEFVEASKLKDSDLSGPKALGDEEVIALARKLGLLDEPGAEKFVADQTPAREALESAYLKKLRDELRPAYLEQLSYATGREKAELAFSQLSDEEVMQLLIQLRNGLDLDPNTNYIGPRPGYASEVTMDPQDPLFDKFTDPIDGYQQIDKILGEEGLSLDRPIGELAEKAASAYARIRGKVDIKGEADRAIAGLKSAASRAAGFDATQAWRDLLPKKDGAFRALVNATDEELFNKDANGVSGREQLLDKITFTWEKPQALAAQKEISFNRKLGEMFAREETLGNISDFDSFSARYGKEFPFALIAEDVGRQAALMEAFQNIRRIAMSTDTPSETLRGIHDFYQHRGEVAALRAVRRIERETWWANNMEKAKKPINWAMTALDGLYRRGDKFEGTPLPDRKAAYRNSVMQPIFAVCAKTPGLWDDFMQNAHSKEIVNYLATGEGELRPDVKELADTLRMATEAQRAALCDLGADIAESPGFVYNQSYSAGRARGVTREEFVSDLRNAIDWEGTYKAHGGVSPFEGKGLPKDIESANSFLSGLYDWVMSEGWKEGLNPELDTGHLAAQLSHHKVVKIKPEAFYEWDVKYGSGSPSRAFVTMLQRRADTLAIMEAMGPDPHVIADMVLKEHASDSLFTHNFEGVFRQVTGELDSPVSEKLASIGRVERAISNLIYMGGSGLAALTDIPNICATLKYHNIPVGLLGKDVFSRYAHYAKQGTREQQLFLLDLGAGTDSLLRHSGERMIGDPSATGRIGVMNDAMFYFNQLERLTKAGQNTFMAMMSNGIAEGKVTAETTSRFGLVESDLALLREHSHTVEGFTGKHVSPSDVREKFPELADNYSAFLQHTMREAIIEPDPSSQAFARLWTKDGTVKGVLARTFMQYAAFPHAMLRKTWGRIYNGYGEESFWKNFGDPRSRQHIETLTYVGTMLAMGYVVMSLKDILKGREPMTLGDINAQNITRIISQSGIAGPLGGLFSSDLNPIGDIGSPIVHAAAGTLLAPFQKQGGGMAKVVLNNFPGQSFPIAGEAAKNLLAHVFGDAFIGINQYNMMRLQALTNLTGQRSIYSELYSKPSKPTARRIREKLSEEAPDDVSGSE